MSTTDNHHPDGGPVLVRMRALRPELRPSERRIADHFLQDAASAAEESIASIAASCRTSTTSVVRFVRRLGYERVNQLRADVQREAAREQFATEGLPEVSGDISRDDTVEDVIAKVSLAETLSISDTAKTLDPEAVARTVAAMHAARRIDVFGVGASSMVAVDLQQKLNRIGRTAFGWHDAHSAWTAAATLDDACVAVAISHSGATTDTVDYLALARASGATTIALTNHASAPLTRHADIVLTTAARETGFRSGALGSRIAQLMVVDCVFIGVAQADYDRSTAAIRATYDAVQRLRTRGA